MGMGMGMGACYLSSRLARFTAACAALDHLSFWTSASRCALDTGRFFGGNAARRGKPAGRLDWFFRRAARLLAPAI